jgi:Icc protein
MNVSSSKHVFKPSHPDSAGVVSWVHLGDLHMTKTGEQNHLDLATIVDEVNQVFSHSISFVFMPGDIADDGSRAAYAVVRAELDRLYIPWCAIVGDHDIHGKSLLNFLEVMSEQARYTFNVGSVKFIAMNAFDIPHPASFTVSSDQLDWVKHELQTAAAAGHSAVLLLHCYPSDLKEGGTELSDLLRAFDVRLVDMGHTHYNEIANDGRTLYAATRSTGQIEEGPVGYSIINIDGAVVSWRFVELGKLPVVVITSPAEDRLLTKPTNARPAAVKVRAKFWGHNEATKATAYWNEQVLTMQRIANSSVWETDVPDPRDDVNSLKVSIVDASGKVATDQIQVVYGDLSKPMRYDRDQDNALAAWPEHGLVGTQLGPNKNGKKW